MIKKENIYIICSSHLHSLLEKNLLQKFLIKKGSVVIDHEFKELDFIICKQSEVILTNINMDIDPDKLANLTKVNKKLQKNTSDHRIKKTKDLPKDSSVTLNSEDNIKGSKEENEISTKRKSYRQKVKDFKTNKLKSGDSAKIPKKITI